MNIDELSLDELHEIANLELRWWNSSSGRIELVMSVEDAESVSHPGPCDSDVAALLTRPYIRQQLDNVDPADVVSELAEHGAWDDTELSDHDSNLNRLIWCAGCDISGAEARRRG